jgi:hypothetical protein
MRFICVLYLRLGKHIYFNNSEWDVQELADEKALHVVSVCSHHKTSRLSPLISVEIVRVYCHPKTSRLSPFDICRIN